MKSSESNRLSILMFTMSFHPSPMGGAEIQAFRLAKELMGQGMDVSFITLAQKGQSKRDVIDGIEVFSDRLFFHLFIILPEKSPRIIRRVNTGRIILKTSRLLKRDH
ncbi:MAG: hypothetical protein IPJ20_00485 [Flammeovirgaceae bacterium]|nr:hypothetical protein [Flammeovirgaceae bacterium]